MEVHQFHFFHIVLFRHHTSKLRLYDLPEILVEPNPRVILKWAEIVDPVGHVGFIDRAFDLFERTLIYSIEDCLELLTRCGIIFGRARRCCMKCKHGYHRDNDQPFYMNSCLPDHSPAKVA